MIAALAVDPFMQQIISYPLRSVPTAEIEGATTPIARTYDSGTVMDAATAKSNFAGVDMQTAIVNGLLGISLTPTFHCSTGNCTWPELTKLGVCGSCMNVTEETKKDCGDRDPDSSMQTCDYTTPANITITATTGLGGNGTYTYLNSSAMSISADDNAPLLRLGILRSPPTANVDKDGVLPPDISECSFEWCAQQCSGFSVSKGVLQQGGLVSAPLNAFSNGSWTPAYVGDRVYASLQAPDGTWQGNRTFFVHTADYNIARQLLENLLVTQLASFNEEAPAFQVAPILLFATNISQTMADIATSMTNVMQSSDNGTEVIGQAFHNETFVHVRWPWLILPATLVFITAILLQAAVVESHRRNSLLWKSSILPFLFHGFEKPVDAPPEKLSLVEARAWRMAACLQKINEREYRFILA
ncbi:hypothetical protein SLS56_009159 [Neofusicoccum ribis]|uniref:Uncharacterized protein n=1 Tax=Neofusicoccum ribis TaxID=45134 RepID=A0ABR3SI44_9PEZI